MLQVIDVSFNDVLDWEHWKPTDPFDIDEWIEIVIGENGAGSLYQVHLCTNISIKNINDKKYIFKLEKWGGPESLLHDLNKFIEKAINEQNTEDPYYVLSKYWQWEYSKN